MFAQQQAHEFIPDDCIIISKNLLTAGGLLETLELRGGAGQIHLVALKINNVHSGPRWVAFRDAGIWKFTMTCPKYGYISLYWSPPGLQLTTGVEELEFHAEAVAANYLSYYIAWRIGWEIL